MVWCSTSADPDVLATYVLALLKKVTPSCKLLRHPHNALNRADGAPHRGSGSLHTLASSRSDTHTDSWCLSGARLSSPRSPLSPQNQAVRLTVVHTQDKAPEELKKNCLEELEAFLEGGTAIIPRCIHPSSSSIVPEGRSDTFICLSCDTVPLLLLLVIFSACVWAISAAHTSADHLCGSETGGFVTELFDTIEARSYLPAESLQKVRKQLFVEYQRQ